MSTMRRIKIVLDDGPDRPDFDPEPPLIAIRRDRWTPYIEIVEGDNYIDEDWIKEVWKAAYNLESMTSRTAEEIFERWVTYHLGKVQWWYLENHRTNDSYVSVLTKEWLTAAGFDPKVGYPRDLERPSFVYWADGEVYGIVAQRLRTMAEVNEFGKVIGDTEVEWVEDESVGSIWGFYGRDSAIEGAGDHAPWDTYDIVEEDGTVIKEVRP